MTKYNQFALVAGFLMILACGGIGGGSNDVTAIKSTVTGYNPKNAANPCNIGSAHIEFDGHALRHNQSDTPLVEFKMGAVTHDATFNFGDDTSVDYTVPCLANGTWDVYYDGTKVGTFSVP